MDLVTSDVETQGEVGPLAELKRKEKYVGKIVKITLAGAIIDIGIGIPGVVHISQLQEEPVNRVEDVVHVGQEVDVWVKRVFPKKNRVELTMVRPLELEWREIEPDMVVKGKVVRLEKYGAFIDIGAERPGLVHISEMSHSYVKGPEEVVKEGDEVEVKILQVSRKKKQIKLSMKALIEPPAPTEKPSGAGKRNNRGRSNDAADDRSQAVDSNQAGEAEEQEYVPTAIEFAWRKAMERSHDDEKSQREKGEKGKKGESDDYLARTLESRPNN